MSNPPSIREELNRKVVDTLELLLVRQSRGEVTVSEMKVAIDAVYTATVGLLSEETIDLMTTIEKTLEA